LNVAIFTAEAHLAPVVAAPLTIVTIGAIVLFSFLADGAVGNVNLSGDTRDLDECQTTLPETQLKATVHSNTVFPEKQQYGTTFPRPGFPGIFFDKREV
jgi:hypothetical protein